MEPMEREMDTPEASGLAEPWIADSEAGSELLEPNPRPAPPTAVVVEIFPALALSAAAALPAALGGLAVNGPVVGVGYPAPILSGANFRDAASRGAAS
jgi:hypothetical protein